MLNREVPGSIPGIFKILFRPRLDRLTNLKTIVFEPRKAIIFGFLRLQKNDYTGRFRRQAEEENSIEWRNKGKNDKKLQRQLNF